MRSSLPAKSKVVIVMIVSSSSVVLTRVVGRVDDGMDGLDDDDGGVVEEAVARLVVLTDRLTDELLLLVRLLLVVGTETEERVEEVERVLEVLDGTPEEVGTGVTSANASSSLLAHPSASSTGGMPSQIPPKSSKTGSSARRRHGSKTTERKRHDFMNAWKRSGFSARRDQNSSLRMIFPYSVRLGRSYERGARFQMVYCSRLRQEDC